MTGRQPLRTCVLRVVCPTKIKGRRKQNVFTAVGTHRNSLGQRSTSRRDQYHSPVVLGDRVTSFFGPQLLQQPLNILREHPLLVAGTCNPVPPPRGLKESFQFSSDCRL